MTMGHLFEFSRRQVLAGALGGVSVGLTGCITSAPARSFFQRNSLPIGVQLYTVSDAARQDLAGTFLRLAQIGFETVELAGYHGNAPAALKASADRSGLRLVSSDLPPAAFDDGPSLSGDLPRLAADLHILGIPQIVLSRHVAPAQIGPKRPDEDAFRYRVRVAAAMTRQDWSQTALFLNEKAEVLRREGIALGYHNHNAEFAPIGSSNGLDILMRETYPSVFFELDAGWAAAGGADIISLLKKYPGRFRMMHVKDILPTTRTNYLLEQQPTEVGQGAIDWPAILPAAHDAGIEYFFVEQEPPFKKGRFESLAESYAYLSTL